MVYGETGIKISAFHEYVCEMCKVLVAYFKDVSSQAAVSLHERNRRAWASSVCYVLYRHGFDEVWENQGVGDERKKIERI